MKFLYGKWTEYIKCCSAAAYEQWAKERGEEASAQTPSHTPKKMLAKLNSFKVGALRSMSIQDVSIWCYLYSYSYLFAFLGQGYT